jgi:hypothetical protein
MYVEQPDRFGRTLAIALGLWFSVGVIVWMAFVLAFPNPSRRAPSGPEWHSSSSAAQTQPAR